MVPKISPTFSSTDVDESIHRLLCRIRTKSAILFNLNEDVFFIETSVFVNVRALVPHLKAAFLRYHRF